MKAPHSLVNHLSTAVIVLSEEGVCVFANDACQDLLHKSKQWLDGRSLETLFLTNDDVVQHCRAALKHHQSISLREVEIHLPDWQLSLLLDINISPYSVDNHLGLLLELIDRKQSKKLAQDIDKTARFKAATQIIRGLCHEIKNPLGGIRGAAQLLAMDTDNTETLEYSRVITHEVDRLSALLDRMSGGAMSEKREQADIHEILLHAANLLKAEHGESFELRFDFDTSLPTVLANVGQLEQALLNLMINAVQWSMIAFGLDEKVQKHKPVVSLKTRAAYPDLMRSLMPQSGIQIQILDSGPGVDPAIIDQLFLPLVSKREGGTGLGLVISQEIIQAHGGFIELDENQAPIGAGFSVYLPYSSREEK